MTNHSMAPAELVEKGSDVDFVLEMLQFIAHRIMEADVEGRGGAPYGDREVRRHNSRNGYPLTRVVTAFTRTRSGFGARNTTG